MPSYTHLTLAEREQLYALKTAGASLRTIAAQLGRSHTSIARELTRNSQGIAATLTPRNYLPCKAHIKAASRAQHQRTKAPLISPEIRTYVRAKLKEGWSPEQIAGRYRREHPESRLHHETIYRYVYSSQGRKLLLDALLPQRRPKRHKRSIPRSHGRGRLRGVASLEHRPSVGQERRQLGHWETDTFIGGQEELARVVVCLERKSRYIMLSKVEQGTAEAVGIAVAKQLSLLPPPLRQSLTMDHGRENTQHPSFAKLLGYDTYACAPYRPYEKGSIENAIGRLRLYLPKRQPLALITKPHLLLLQHQANTTPRKCLNYLTPSEVLWQDTETKGGAL